MAEKLTILTSLTLPTIVLKVYQAATKVLAKWVLILMLIVKILKETHHIEVCWLCPRRTNGAEKKKMIEMEKFFPFLICYCKNICELRSMDNESIPEWISDMKNYLDNTCEQLKVMDMDSIFKTGELIAGMFFY